jgi:hypothetical protein
MRWRIIGIALLLVSIIVLGTMVFSYPTSNKSRTLLDEQVPVLYVYAATELGAPIVAERNITLNPLTQPPKTEYVVNVIVKATEANTTGNKEAPIDFWMVNHTGRNMIWSYLENETYLGYLPNASYSLPGIKAYGRSIDSSLIAKTLRGLDYDGNYTIMLINPHEKVQAANTSIVVEETIVTMGYLVNADAVSISLTGVLAFAGIALAVKPPRKVSRHGQKR